MAVARADGPNEMLQPRFSNLAAGLSTIFSLVAIASQVAAIIDGRDQSAAELIGRIAAIAFFALLIVSAGYLLRRRAWAQKLLLVAWSLQAAGALVALIGSILFEAQGPWPSVFDLPPQAVMIGVAAAGSAMVVLLTLASAPGTRLRYGTLVSVSIVTAIALVVLVNMIVQAQPVRKDFQLLGRYGLSQRTRRILQSVDGEVRLTCIYTKDDEATASKYRPRILEYLNELRQEARSQGLDVQVVNITTDAQKDRLIQRLWQRQSAKSGPHLAALEKFRKLAPQLAEQLESQAKRWTQIPADSNLGRWGVHIQVADMLSKSAKSIRQVTQRIDLQLNDRTSLPDTKLLMQQAIDAFDSTEDQLRTAKTNLEKISRIPSAVQANSTETVESLEETYAAAVGMVDAVGKQGDPIPAKASHVLDALVAAAKKAAALAYDSADRLDQIAGKDNADLLAQSPAWQIDIAIGRTESGATLVQRTTLSGLVRAFGDTIDQLKISAQGLASAAKEEHIRQVLPRWRKQVADLTAQLKQAVDGTKRAIEQLTNVDTASKEIYDALADNSLFKDAMDQMRDWLKEARDLPELEKSRISEDLSQDNIILVEVKDKAEVLHFDEVWPEVIPTSDRRRRSSEGDRVFNGDSAIGSRVLSMTHEPFATVLLTYFKPKMEPQVQRLFWRGLTPDNLRELQDRLRQANFEVKLWNLTEEMPARSKQQADRPRVLLILPPPPPSIAQLGQRIPDFGPKQVEKIRAAIDSTDDPVAAVFLTHYVWPVRIDRRMPPMSLPYGLRNYLLRDWGIDVKSDYRVMSFLPDPNLPGKFRVDATLLQYTTINGFADHPITKPLQAQRTYWTDLCPVLPGGDPAATTQPVEGVQVTTLLQVPAGQRNVWATRRIMELGEEFYKSPSNTVEPNYQRGDLKAPFSLALAATRSAGSRGDRKFGPSRIVVLPITMSLLDGYLRSKVPVPNNEGGLTLTDPPRADADFVINSIYWLSGYQRYIAAGPVRIKPVEMIDRATLWKLWGLCVVVLPLLILTTGLVVVLVVRRR